MKVADYSNKTVSFRYKNVTLKFFLSQHLFSSFDIDPGSKLLLKFCLEYIKTRTIRKILDIGCGVGTLGLSLAASLPGVSCILQDRDSLAVEFSRINAEQNGLAANCTFIAEPLFLNFHGSYDLVVSNIPAKAGNRVINAWIREIPSLLNPGAAIALVIVKPLSDLLHTALQENAFEIVHSFSNSQYSVFICTHDALSHHSSRNTGLPDFYFRQSAVFTHDQISYRLCSAYNLPDFDTPGYDLDCAFRCFRKSFTCTGAIFINCRQGHLPVFLYESSIISGDAFIAGSDTLALEVCAKNLKPYCTVHKIIASTPVDALEQCNRNFELITVRIPDSLPKKTVTELCLAVNSTLQKNAHILIYGRTFEVNEFGSGIRGLVIQSQSKNKGFLSILCKKVI
ncbi:MAG: methyltransferase [Spirochaetales bacterium]|nr:methyltransferase [Spirochaetales bacterium]